MVYSGVFHVNLFYMYVLLMQVIFCDKEKFHFDWMATHYHTYYKVYENKENFYH